MADKKISALTSLAQGDVAASTDVLPIVDTSATETKKITASALVGAGMTAGVTNVDINSGAIDGTTIGANSAAAGTFTNLTASGTVSFSGATVSNGGAVTTIDINGGTIDATSIGASSASTGAFTTLSASSTVSGTGFSTYLASPPAIGGTTAAAGSFTTLTTSSTVTLNGGTANGVLYLNGSKVATSGSALTFDGTILTTPRINVTNTGTGATFSSSGGSGMRVYGSSGTNQWDVYLNSTNLRLSDNTGGGQLYVDTGAYFGGNVGIGTSSPGAKLETYRSSSGEVARFTASADGFRSLKFISSDNTGSGAVWTRDIDSAYAQHRWAKSGTPLMVLDESGNLLIGQTTNTQNYRLVIKGSAGTADDLALNTDGTRSEIQSFNSKPLELNRQGNNVLIGSGGSGNLGIGTASPAYRLHVVGGAAIANRTTSDTPGNISLGVLSTASAATFGWRTDTSNNLHFDIYNGASWSAALTTSLSGNLGLGVTPSASSVKTFEITAAGNTLTGFGGGDIALMSNAYFNSGFKYGGSNLATSYRQQDGVHKWNIAATGTAGNTISFTQAMTLDASGNLGVGTTNPTQRLHIVSSGQPTILIADDAGRQVSIKSPDSSGNPGFVGTTTNHNLLLQAGTSGAGANVMLFNTAGSERGRFTAGGYFKASNTGGYDSATGTYHEFLNNDASDNVLLITHFGATNPNGVGISFTAASPDNNTQHFLRCADSTTARCFIYSDGDLANHDGVYGTISDERLKRDIVDAPSQWDDLKAVRFRKYRMKTDVEANADAPALLGVVAQELEQTSPGLIDEHLNEDGTTTKTVKSSILLMKAAVALQEAMTRIEQLEAKVAALESK